MVQYETLLHRNSRSFAYEATFADKSPLIPCIGGMVAVGKWGMEENGAV